MPTKNENEVKAAAVGGIPGAFIGFFVAGPIGAVVGGLAGWFGLRAMFGTEGTNNKTVPSKPTTFVPGVIDEPKTSLTLKDKLAVKVGDNVTVILPLTTPIGIGGKDIETFDPLSPAMIQLGQLAMSGAQVKIAVKEVTDFPGEPPESSRSWAGTMLEPPNVDLLFAVASITKIEKRVF